MWQNTKIRGMKSILMSAVMLAAITMPHRVEAQAAPPVKEWTVVIDAGHGGKDPGSIGYSKTKEKDLNLKVAIKTGQTIKENLKDVKVIYTRTDDTFLGLDERAEVANKNKADIFISIHANAWKDKRPYGAETFVLGQSMDDANLKVAMKENSVITFEEDYQTKYEGYDPNSVESFIIFSLMQNTYLKQSTEFASLIQYQFRDRVGRFDRGVKQAGLVVLWRSTMPSVLVELGFITHPEEEKFLLSELGQDYLASAIFRAFRAYKNSIDNRSGIKPLIGEKQDKVEENPVQVKAEMNDTHSVTVTGKQTAVPVAGNPAPVPAPEKTSPAASAGNGIVFMVQIAAVPKNKTSGEMSFKGINTVTRIESGERYKYAAGRFSLFEEALEYRRVITKEYPDAFVIAVRNGKVIPLKDAVDEINSNNKK